ncbi:hypothetical protein FRX31_006765 [Thalictrum thalictroides]|uniref:Uncharacterized protein n=1 Tax=Thalictrum thalictroides TaxID=46969 RepID=A0A7J6X499_THATH|nr:hypothetical protein FRX31_034684 [Thalictrum thalictroides]KAF5203648.1 hypothetical protein FRX31_006765 [Thalictrum thalictroides]
MSGGLQADHKANSKYSQSQAHSFPQPPFHHLEDTVTTTYMSQLLQVLNQVQLLAYSSARKS